jgi:formylglycine-generating enzyme required for sulfatase activity
MMKEYEQALKSYEEAQILYEEIEDAVGGWFPNPPRVMIARVKNKIAYRNLNLEPFSFETVMVNEQGKVIKKEVKEAGYLIQLLPGNIDLEMVSIPEGQFWMGSPEGEGYDWEKPQHLVKIAPFFIGKTPITQQQWRAVASLPKEQIELNPKPSHFKGDTIITEGMSALAAVNASFESDNLPVERVSWQDAIEFCARLSRYTGMNYRLPSEAEWEYACRAIQNPEELVKGVGDIPVYPPFHFGETITSELANYDGSFTYKEEPEGQYRAETTPVRSFLPNAFGLYDMHGNVWEWCLDPWHKNYEGAPSDGGVWDGNNNNYHYHNILDNINVLIKDGRTHVLRGGYWDDHPRDCRSASRFSYDTYYAGFRPVFSFQDSSPFHS